MSSRGGLSRGAIGVLVVCCLAIPAGITLAAAALAIVQPVGLDYAEPVIYGQALRLVSGEPLYQSIDRPPFTVAAYTPLYYWLAAALQMVVGLGFMPGRVLSLAAGVMTSVMVGATARRGYGGLWVGAVAGLLFLGLGLPGPVPWLGLYRVDLLGVALSVASVALLARSTRTRTRTLVAAGVLAGLAVLCKQTFLAALMAGTLCEWRLWKRVGTFLGSALLTFGIPCLLLEVTTGGAFLENTVLANVNPFDPSIAAGLAPIFLETQWLPLLLAVVYVAVRRPWQASDSRLLGLYWGLASVSLVLGIAKVGASTNYWIEFAAATAILAARGAALAVNTSRRVVLAGALILAIGVAMIVPGGVRASMRAIRSDLGVGAPERNAEFNALVNRVRREPGAVLAEPMDVVVLAGRPVLLEPFIYNLLLDADRWRPDSLVARICKGEIGLLVLGYPVEVGGRLTDGLYALWPAPVMTALQNSMELDGVAARRYVYTPRRSPAPGCLDQ